uniref:Uncharacterized protein n=1 Tax=Candidatus Kentrum sp. FW TaxID=2126338 RepID=A0A450TNF8_9GAMM|nr:MAG: hypothetical protein BECKFW1821C_GA0114237_101844 [Candidatus Kentron sp. FW]
MWMRLRIGENAKLCFGEAIHSYVEFVEGLCNSFPLVSLILFGESRRNYSLLILDSLPCYTLIASFPR